MGPTCDILNTGSELLLGRTLNRHGQWLGRRLTPLGVSIRRQVTLPDGDIIREELEHSLANADIVLVTGGLGPTSDDKTRDFATAVLGLPLTRDPVALDSLRQRFHARGRSLSEAQARQADLPDGALALPNPFGTAPGIWCGPAQTSPHRSRLLCLLPGPPSELRPMFNEHVLPALTRLFALEQPDESLAAFHFAGIGEGDLAALVEPGLPGDTGVEIGYCAHGTGCMELRLTGSGDSVARASSWVRQHLAAECFGEGETTLEQAVVRLLADQGQTVATAESCTGGLLASRITDVPGASDVFGHGFVSYANEAKSRWLGVAPEILTKYGSVSRETAAAMAEGALAASGSHHALALTGIAGPGGGTKDKPVGTLWIGLASRGRTTICSNHLFQNGRSMFKQIATTRALDMLRRRLATSIPRNR